jgi:K+-transporting ATPase KdpF subunit
MFGFRILAAVLAGGLSIYLVAALLVPERFQ